MYGFTMCNTTSVVCQFLVYLIEFVQGAVYFIQ